VGVFAVSAIAKMARLTRSRADWADAINATWQRAVTHAVQVVILTGREIIEAKEALPHGEFLEMITSDLPFEANTAQRLMKIARDQRLSNAAHVPHLPPTWGTLYELTKLSDEQLEKGFEAGTIHRAMERKDVAALRGKVRKPRTKKAAAQERASDRVIGPIDRCAMDKRRQIFAALQAMNMGDRKQLIIRLQEEIDDLSAKNAGE
jgi:Protein of unknown function (DUF3102)